MADITTIELQNFDIEIKADGRWFHEGGEIKRIGLVKLFASVLSCDEDGRYWLTTPVEKGEIQVARRTFHHHKITPRRQWRRPVPLLE